MMFRFRIHYDLDVLVQEVAFDDVQFHGAVSSIARTENVLRRLTEHKRVLRATLYRSVYLHPLDAAVPGLIARESCGAHGQPRTAVPFRTPAR